MSRLKTSASILRAARAVIYKTIAKDYKKFAPSQRSARAKPIGEIAKALKLPLDLIWEDLEAQHPSVDDIINQIVALISVTNEQTSRSYRVDFTAVAWNGIL
jgi:hypothetical protein